MGSGSVLLSTTQTSKSAKFWPTTDLNGRSSNTGLFLAGIITDNLTPLGVAMQVLQFQQYLANIIHICKLFIFYLHPKFKKPVNVMLSIDHLELSFDDEQLLTILIARLYFNTATRQDVEDHISSGP